MKYEEEKFDKETTRHQRKTIPQGAEEAWRNLACVATFGLVYYFLMAAVTWWVALCVAWFLAAEKGWCPEGISRYIKGGKHESYSWFNLVLNPNQWDLRHQIST